MRRLNKNCNLSTKYKAWLGRLERSGRDHPKYTSSNHKYYFDVAMNLYKCQAGLCAYTEMFLCAEEHYHESKWADGRYTTRPKIFGQLEHFDSRLKDKKAWLWDNLFMVHTDVNTRVKRTQAVDRILKPDAPSYDPFARLEYNSKLHMFLPHRKLSAQKKKRVWRMLDILGINHSTVCNMRRRFFAPRLKLIAFGSDTWDTIVVNEFPTAFEMVKRKAA